MIVEYQSKRYRCAERSRNQTKEVEERREIAMEEDTEIVALEALGAALKPLSTEARRRILQWAWARLLSDEQREKEGK
jgi:uncharacterized protein YuzE